MARAAPASAFGASDQAQQGGGVSGRQQSRKPDSKKPAAARPGRLKREVLGSRVGLTRRAILHSDEIYTVPSDGGQRRMESIYRNWPVGGPDRLRWRAESLGHTCFR